VQAQAGGYSASASKGFSIMSETILARPNAITLAFPVLLAAGACHLLNDLMQSLFTASYPIFKSSFDLSFEQIGLLTLTYQLSASILQPLVGFYTDNNPKPYSLPFGMRFSMAGLVTLAFAPTHLMLLLGGAFLGVGSSIFHPESSRVARLASGGSHGLAQSIFQVGGNFGTSLGPLLVAFIVLAGGQSRLAWFALLASLGIVILAGLGRWYQTHRHPTPRIMPSKVDAAGLSKGKLGGAIAILTALTLSKYFYIASFTTYYIFYLMQRFNLPERTAQICLFVFLGSVALGTLIGGPVGDRIGRKKVIWGSILRPFDAGCENGRTSRPRDASARPLRLAFSLRLSYMPRHSAGGFYAAPVQGSAPVARLASPVTIRRGSTGQG
jgi:MFS transporter, FSR family, fosmidomycin resistance protein